MTRRRASAAMLILASLGLVAATVPAAAVSAPKPADDSATVTSGGTESIDVLTNDSDPDGGSLSVTAITPKPKHGTATTDGVTITYTSTAPFVGQDVFGYRVSDGDQSSVGQVTMTVTSYTNKAPHAVDDRSRVRWHATVHVPVLTNDTDEDEDPLSVTDVTRAQHGATDFSASEVTYTPHTGFKGVDTFTYTVSDGRGGEDTGLVTVAVLPSYDVLLSRPHRAVALRGTALAGHVSTRDGANVAITIVRAVDRVHWRPIAKTQVRGDGTFHHRWRPNTPGQQRLRAVAIWSSGHRDISPVLRLRVSAHFDPVVSEVTRKDVRHTYRRGCPVGPSSLRKIEMNYWDYHKRLHRGTLIGAVWAVDAYKVFFERAFRTKFLIKKMYPADRYGGNDKRAMRAGDTSAFNCRHVTGNPYQISEHSYGDAIDINTFENPYVTGSHVYPPKAAGRYYWHRAQHLRDPGVITKRSTIARAMTKRGWLWGARWANPDYQHWSINGG